MAADIYCIEDVLLNLSHMEKILSGKSIETATSHQTYTATVVRIYLQLRRNKMKKRND